MKTTPTKRRRDGSPIALPYLLQRQVQLAVPEPVVAAHRTTGRSNSPLYITTSKHTHGWYNPIGNTWHPATPPGPYDNQHARLGRLHWTTCWQIFHHTRPAPAVHAQQLPNLIDHPHNTIHYTPVEHLVHHHGLPTRAFTGLTIQAGMATIEYILGLTDEELLDTQYIGPGILADFHHAAGDCEAWKTEGGHCDRVGTP